jgi:hypothetical protein
MSTSALLSGSLPPTARGRFTVLSATPSKLGSSPTFIARPGHAGHSHSASGSAGDNGEFGESKNPRCMELTRAEIGVFVAIPVPKGWTDFTCAGVGTGGSPCAVTLLSASVADSTVTVTCLSWSPTGANGAETGDAGKGTSAGLTSGLDGNGVVIAAAGIFYSFGLAFGGMALPFDRIVRGFVDLTTTRCDFSSSAAFMRASWESVGCIGPPMRAPTFFG